MATGMTKNRDVIVSNIKEFWNDRGSKTLFFYWWVPRFFFFKFPSVIELPWVFHTINFQVKTVKIITLSGIFPLKIKQILKPCQLSDVCRLPLNCKWRPGTRICMKCYYTYLQSYIIRTCINMEVSCVLSFKIPANNPLVLMSVGCIAKFIALWTLTLVLALG